MVRIVATIALILALAVSASAMTQPRYATIGSESTSGTATVSTSSQAAVNDLMIMVCYDLTGGSLTAITTGGLTWTTVTGTGLPLTNILIVTRTVGVSEPATVGATFTATHRAACGLAYQHNSDGTVPTLDIACGSTTSTVCSVTTTRPNDSLVYATVDSNPLQNTASALPFAPLFIYQGPSLSINWVYGGQGASGASITPTFVFNGGSVGGIITLAFKNTSATAAANFVGLGTEGFNGGSSLTVGPTTATNSTAGSNSISIAEISQLAGSTGIAITAPPQIVYRYAPVYVSGAGNQTFTIDANSVAGDFLTETFGNGAVMSAPAACGAHAWTTLASSGSFIGVFGKILDSCDPGHTYSFTGFSGGVNRGAIDFVSQGATISVDVASCSAIGSTSNPSIPSITTTSNNDTAFSALFGQGLATTPVPPASNFILWQNNGSAAAAGLYRQDTVGATGAQNYTTPSAAQTWLACNVSLKTSTAAASPWNTVAACPTGIADPTGNNQTTAFWAANLPQNVTELFSFASKPASSGGRIYNFNGLNSTNPIDVCATLGLPGMDNIYAPSLTPTPNDDGILRLFPASTSNAVNNVTLTWVNLLVASANANGPSAVFDSLGQVKSAAVTNNGDGNAFGSLSLGLNASQ
jgi:hypothetical protein